MDVVAALGLKLGEGSGSSREAGDEDDVVEEGLKAGEVLTVGVVVEVADNGW